MRVDQELADSDDDDAMDGVDEGSKKYLPETIGIWNNQEVMQKYPNQEPPIKQKFESLEA